MQGTFIKQESIGGKHPHSVLCWGVVSTYDVLLSAHFLFGPQQQEVGVNKEFRPMNICLLKKVTHRALVRTLQVQWVF